ncbi:MULTISPECIES: hypothetical protein [Cyclobacterium]|uniref:Anti-sigma factor n=1 Tax=Cyclobacterium plantarum TaxID=2716263 RepID=A0ABX0HEM9_9BACT|nr:MULTISPECIES: hypothetical protein [Cyclobacterium]MBD3626569.1 hypothetical protein [Cyclobacterium sp.]NHE58460.1 hypothetical protein [Cyclobacterium plantarum]
MTKSFTQSELIRFIYQEMTEEENETLMQSLKKDPLLMQEYIDLLSTVEKLDQLLLEPSESIVYAIKKRARSRGLEKV